MARILLLIPHPDDEVVGAAATITRRRAAGDEFFSLYLTDGIPSAEQLWRRDRPRRAARVERRRHEARAAAAILGIKPVAFLGFPSRALKSHLNEATVAIQKACAESSVDALWVPAWEGGHQDHDVANFLASRRADGRPVIEFAEYNRNGGAVRWNRFAEVNGTEAELRLTPDEIAAKQRLIAIYGSESANLAGVRFEVESQRPLPAYDYAKPPHDGMLLRERFHWVGHLFRHPRVDFEPSASVYETLKQYR